MNRTPVMASIQHAIGLAILWAEERLRGVDGEFEYRDGCSLNKFDFFKSRVVAEQ